MPISKLLRAARSALFNRGKPPTASSATTRSALAYGLAAFLVALTPGAASAQQVLSVPFNGGFIGKYNGSPNTAVQTYTFAGVPGVTGGITRAFFSQNLTSAATQFESCNGSSFLYGATLDLCGHGAQGNDVPGFLTLVDGSGISYRFAGFYKFRGPSSAQPDQNSTYVFVVLQNGTVGSLGIVAGATDSANTNANYSLIGTVLNGKRNAATVTSAVDGDGSFSGNAASSSVLDGLRSYYSATVAARPAGPVSVVSQRTADTTPTISGSVVLEASETLEVTVNGVTYVQGDGKLSVFGTSWTLEIPTEMATGTYDVDAIIIDEAGYILADSTAGELIIAEPVASIAVVKTATLNDDDEFTGPSAGDTITYTFTVKNTGDMTLSDVTVTDPLVEVTGGPIASMAPGAEEKDTFTATYTVTQSDIEAGMVTNQALVTASSPTGSDDVTDRSGTAYDNDRSTVTPLAEQGQASIALVKTAQLNDDDGTTGLSAGDTITYSFTVKNTGEVALSDVTVTDPMVTVTGGPIASMAPGAEEKDTFTASYVLTQEDIDSGKVTNQATVTASSPTGEDDVTDTSGTAADNDTATETELAGQSPLLKITKTVDESDLADGAQAGDVLDYTIEIENTGNVTITDLSLTDTFTDAEGNELTLSTAPYLPGDTLAPGEGWTLTADFILTDAAIAAGGVKNIATISGQAPDGTSVEAESTAEGNTSADGSGTSTDTGFPGGITGQVRNYLSGAAGVTVYLLMETAPGSDVYEAVLDQDGEPVFAVTDEDGSYAFSNLPPANYGVRFEAPHAGSALTASSPEALADGNQITRIAVGAGSVEMDNDAFFVDPAGVVYDSETFFPVGGAKVTLLYDGAPVPDSWLNGDLGDLNGALTGPDGGYFFLLDPSVAPSGTYTLMVERNGYKPSTTVPPVSGAYTPGLGGGVERIVLDDQPSEGQPQTYYLAFNFTFTDDPDTTSNGIANNHIPMDFTLTRGITQDVTDILHKDLAATMLQQAGRMQGYAKAALDRLKSRDGNSCKSALDAALADGQIQFVSGTAEISADSTALLDTLGQILARCDGLHIEVAAHTDDQGDDTANLALSQSRAESVVSALETRGVPVGVLTGKGYGESRPIADNRTEAGRVANRRVEFTVLAREEDPCINSSRTDHDLTADVHGKAGTVDGHFTRESHDCVTDSWRIVSGDVSLLETEDGIDQSMVNLSIRKERFVTEDRLRGRFLGAYLSRSTVTGEADGTILGYGVNAGLYGANRSAGGLFLDYYLGAAAGRHRFDLDFMRESGVIDATGYYTYGALFAGIALSGETQVHGLVVSPRAGLDLAWSPGGNGSLDAARGALRDSESLSVPGIMGGRGFVELNIQDLLVASPTTLSVTPRLLCDWGMDGLSLGCGYGGTIELTSAPATDGGMFGLSLEASRIHTTTSGRLELRYEQPVGIGRVKGGLETSADGDLGVQAGYSVDF